MNGSANQTELVPDAELTGLMRILPARARPYAALARLERPIGWWLLYWPCLFGLGLSGGLPQLWTLALWMLLGAITMRGAGCVYNDIIDRDLDAQVARTRNRPVASGAVSLMAAWSWLVLLALLGLIVLLQLRWQAQLVALASLAPVAAYPFMKRITWWPQAWLGLVFSWGALVGWMAFADASWAMALVYAGSIFWVIGYDTIYALQDKEDDALIGVRSSARALGTHVRAGVAVFYMAALVFWGAAIWEVRPQALALFALLPAACHQLWQVATLRADDDTDALVKFRSNRVTGLLVALAMITIGASA